MDGICPNCKIRPRKQAYCTHCDNQRQRQRRRALRDGSHVKFQPLARDGNGLTDLHAKILNYMCHGLATSQIASRVGYNVFYVRHRKAELYNITGCINSAHVAAWAVVNGYYKPLDRTSKVAKVAGEQQPQVGVP